MSRIIIKKGSIEVSSDRSDLIQVEETADGIVFNFKYGLHLYLTDPDMPLSTKSLIKVSSDRLSGNKMVFDLSDYQRPAKIDVT